MSITPIPITIFIPSGPDKCPHCGKSLKGPPPSARDWLWIGLITMTVMNVAMVLIKLFI